MDTGSPQRSPAFLESAFKVFDLSLAEMLWSRRSFFLGLVVGAPIVLSIVVRLVALLASGAIRVNGAVVDGASIFGVMMWLLYIRFIVPVLGVFYGTALIADEVDDKTITYLFTRPIPRGAVLMGKYLAYLVSTILLILPSVVIVYFLIVPLGGGSIGGSFPALVADLGILAAGLAAYGALFAFVGMRMRRPLVIGLVFIFGWEPGGLVFPGYLKRFTVGYYLQALVPHSMPTDSSIASLLQVIREVPSIWLSLASLVLICGGALWFAARAVERREYVLDQ